MESLLDRRGCHTTFPELSDRFTGRATKNTNSLGDIENMQWTECEYYTTAVQSAGRERQEWMKVNSAHSKRDQKMSAQKSNRIGAAEKVKYVEWKRRQAVASASLLFTSLT